MIQLINLMLLGILVAVNVGMENWWAAALGAAALGAAMWLVLFAFKWRVEVLRERLDHIKNEISIRDHEELP